MRKGCRTRNWIITGRFVLVGSELRTRAVDGGLEPAGLGAARLRLNGNMIGLIRPRLWFAQDGASASPGVR